MTFSYYYLPTNYYNYRVQFSDNRDIAHPLAIRLHI